MRAATLTALVCAAVVVFAPGAATAAQRAPDLALVVPEGGGRPLTLTTRDPDFAALSRMMQPRYARTERLPEGFSPTVRATVVWGLSGVGGWPQTERPPGGDAAFEGQDQVMAADDPADTTVWVRSDLSVDVDDDDIRWHQVPAGVLDLLAKHHLLGPDRPPAHPDRGGTDGWWWLIPGLAAGYGASVLVRRQLAQPEEPQHQLIDLDA
ncbi:hypothetical protein [Streptomyces sp. NBC_01465]|uniref:hypothetical protein n=1 Tax=Streptomyces sp. NBC_01465 TaxID=2903878 RepID=UPI002E2F3D2F|nr:hypothetical protein [Streptomyces sp. NBC_01465]